MINVVSHSLSHPCVFEETLEIAGLANSPQLISTWVEKLG